MSSPRKPVLKYYDRLNDILNKRTARQFGYGLTDEECITQGIGIREGHAVGDGVYNFLPPTTYFTKDEEERVIDGVRLKLVSAVGETDDQLFVWLPEEEILCCGDNYYACCPISTPFGAASTETSPPGSILSPPLCPTARKSCFPATPFPSAAKKRSRLPWGTSGTPSSPFSSRHWTA